LTGRRDNAEKGNELLFDGLKICTVVRTTSAEYDKSNASAIAVVNSIYFS